MSALPYINSLIFPAAFALLPLRMDTREARAMILSIFLQESRCVYRKQVGGPARGFGQFEQGGGVLGVLTHPASKPHILSVLAALAYDTSTTTSYEAIAHNDVLAVCYARLLLWTHPDALPGPAEAVRAWLMYLDTWRPGKPHPATWAACYQQAWAHA